MLVKQQAGFPSPADVQAVMPIEKFHVVLVVWTCSTWLSVTPMESYVYRMTCTLVDTLSVSGLSHMCHNPVILKTVVPSMYKA